MWAASCPASGARRTAWKPAIWSRWTRIIFRPVRRRQSLTGYLRWDGVKRLDTLFIDYLGAADSEYTRAVTRKTLTAAVARVMCPGIKFDYTLVLTGKQGTGKSTTLKILGGDWHNDSMTVFKGKEVAELIQGYWIIELGELAGMNKAEVNDVKQLATRREDVYREAYGRHAKPYPRQCIFIGTTNDHNYLRDHTGGRRGWPLD